MPQAVTSDRILFNKKTLKDKRFLDQTLT